MTAVDNPAGGSSAVGATAPQVHSGGYSGGVEEHLAGKIEAAHLIAFGIRAVIIGVLCAVPFVVLYLLLLLSGHSPSGLGSLAWLVFLLAAFASLFIPFREAISSWWALVDGRHDAADSAYAAIYGTLTRRRYPVVATPRRVRNTLAQSTARNYLVIHYGKYVVYVSVFGYGTGLYMGWTMWRRQYPLVMFGTFLKQTFEVVTGHGTLFHLILRAEDVQAFREALHSSVTEGLDVALQDLRIPIAATFGHDIPVEPISALTGGSGAGAPSAPLPPRPAAPPSSLP